MHSLMQSLFARIWSWYSKNTFVRHVVVAAVAFTIMKFADPVTEFGANLLNNDSASQGALTAIIAWAVRWAQTHLELTIARLSANQ